jgi:hypothetical protein
MRPKNRPKISDQDQEPSQELRQFAQFGGLKFAPPLSRLLEFAPLLVQAEDPVAGLF